MNGLKVFLPIPAKTMCGMAETKGGTQRSGGKDDGSCPAKSTVLGTLQLAVRLHLPKGLTKTQRKRQL